MNTINYIFCLSVICIIAFLAADCSLASSSCFKALNNFLYPLFIKSFSQIPYCHLRLTLLVSELVCFPSIFSQCCLCALSPISERWPFWSLKCHLKSHSSSSSTNFNHVLQSDPEFTGQQEPLTSMDYESRPDCCQ